MALELELQLNGKDEGETHRSFYGSLLDTMPELRAESRLPASIAYAMKRRLHTPAEVLPAWRKNYVFTADGAEYDGKGAVKIVLDDPALLTLNPKSDLSDGALEHTLQDLENLSGKTVLYLPKKIASDLHEKGYVKEKHSGKYVPQSSDVEKVWNFVSRGEVEIDEYVKMVGEAVKGNPVMRIKLDLNTYETSVGRSLVLCSIVSISYADGNNYLDYYDYGRLVGVAPEAQAGVAQISKALVRMQEEPLVITPESFDRDQYIPQSIHDPESLEYAKRLLQGISSGTVTDWKKHKGIV